MPSATDPVVIPAASTTSIHYGLLRMAHCLVVELPESKLQNVRHSLNVLLGKVDQILDSAEHNFSLNFNGLTIDPSKPCSLHVTFLTHIFSLHGHSQLPGG